MSRSYLWPAHAASIPAAFVLAIVALAVPPAADARDTRHQLPIENAMSAAEAEERLSGDVKFFFGDAEHPPVEKKVGTYTTNKKTNAFGKSDEDACDWAFLSAMIQLEERARAEGGDAVVGIRSIYRGGNLSSETEYECGAGALMAGVTFEGTVVKLK